ncbi:HNH endonuclease [Azonexus sp. IMCC34839]|uniref:HNH endonuclease n=1 Tax=Azonexus sp. IMCC34839 TaxID=3133695 RepID=UPI00399C023E
MTTPKLNTLKPRISALSARTTGAVSSTKRIRGNSLAAIKKRFEKKHHRLCAECERQGLVGFGDELDHIVPLHLGGSESDANRQWLCRRHHSEKTASEARARSTGQAFI